MKTKTRFSMNTRLSIAGVPAMLAFLFFYIVPFGITAWYSTCKNAFDNQFVGLSNYIDIMHNKYFLLALKNTITVSFLTVSFASILAIIFVFLLIRHPSWAKFSLGIILLPLLIPSVSISAIWKMVFHTSAFSNSFISYTAVSSLFVWKYTGISAALLYSGYLSLPYDTLNAAKLDGASSLKLYRFIILPCINKQISIMLLVLFMYSLQLYKECYLLFGEYPSDAIYLLQHYINNHFLKMNFQYVAAGSVSITSLSLLVYVVILSRLYYITDRKQVKNS